MTKPTTVYLDTRLLQAVKIKAVHAHHSVSYFINQAVQESLKEDALDLDDIKTRKNESVASFEKVLDGLRQDGLI